MAKKLIAAAVATTMTAAILSTNAVAQQAPPEKRLKYMDTDGDGSVSLEEFTKARANWANKRDNAEQLMGPEAVKRAFDKIDTDGDGAITLAEFEAAAK